MPQETTELAQISDLPIAKAIGMIGDTYDDQKERKSAMRVILIITQTKTLSEKVEGTWEKKVRSLTVYEAALLYEVCKEYQLNPLMNFVIFLEGNQVYITLQGHLQNAHQSGYFMGMEVEKIPMEGKRTFGYKATVNRMMGDKVVSFTAEGYANDDNVKGSKKRDGSILKDDVAMMQMAEARATRRALSRAFPIGIPYAEDFYETPVDEETPMLPTGIGAVLTAGKETPAPTPASITAPVESEAAKKKRVAAEKKAVEAEAEKMDELASDLRKSEMLQEESSVPEPEVQTAPVQEVPVPSTSDVIEDEKEPVRAAGIDQLNRIKELLAQLGYPPEEIAERLTNISDRDVAQSVI